MTTNNSGAKIKEIRQLKNISIEDVATRSGLGTDQIEMIESGSILPSIAPIIRIARALGVRPGTFLDDESLIGPKVTKAGDRVKGASFSTGDNKSRGHLDFFSLASGKSGRHMEPFIVEVTSGDLSKELSSTHEGEEFIYVLDGCIEINYGKDTYVLSKGDSIYYDSIVSHNVHAGTNCSAKILAVVYAPF